MIHHICIGIDPGAHGAIACLREGAAPDVLPLASATGQEVACWLTSLDDLGPCRVAIERVGVVVAGGRTNAAATAKLMRSAGFIEGVATALGLPWQHVAPSVWQSIYGPLPRRADGAAAHKRALREIAQQLYPRVSDSHRQREVAPTSDTADAILIAEWLRRRP